MTRTRIIRPLFHQSAIVFGVRLSDWKWIIGAAVAAFVFCLLFKLQIRGLHLALPSFIFVFLAGAAFFNWVRLNRRPLWLEHKTAYLFRLFRRKSQNQDRRLPSTHKAKEPWLIDGDYKKLPF